MLIMILLRLGYLHPSYKISQAIYGRRDYIIMHRYDLNMQYTKVRLHKTKHITELTPCTRKLHNTFATCGESQVSR